MLNEEFGNEEARRLSKTKSALRKVKAFLLNPIHRILRKAKNSIFIVTYPSLREAFAITSHLTLEERVELFKLSSHSEAVLEIGSYVGASACCFGAAMKRREVGGGAGRVYCIDTWQNDAMTEGSRDTWQDFTANTAHCRDYIVPVKGFSTDVVEIVASHTSALDLLFIDGDHSYDGVKADWDAYNRFLKPGAIVVFHDWGWAEGVKRVIRENVEPIVSSSDSLPNLWWGKIAQRR